MNLFHKLHTFSKLYVQVVPCHFLIIVKTNSLLGRQKVAACIRHGLVKTVVNGY